MAISHTAGRGQSKSRMVNLKLWRFGLDSIIGVAHAAGWELLFDFCYRAATREQD